MIKVTVQEKPEDHIELEEPLKVIIDEHTYVLFENGAFKVFCDGEFYLGFSAWAFDEIAMAHAKARIDQALKNYYSSVQTPPTDI